MRSKSLIKLFMFVLLISLMGQSIEYTYARVVPPKHYFLDEEISSGNPLSATTLDMDLSSENDHFSDGYDSMHRGEDVERDFKVENTGESAFKYSFDYEYLSGDAVLCNALDLEVSLINSGGDKESKYSGLLIDFTNHDMGEILGPGEDKNYIFEVSVPVDSPYGISSKTCGFKIFAIAWQDNLPDTSWGFSDEESLSGAVITANWPPTAPVGLTIINADGKDIGCDGLTNDAGLKFDWDSNSEFDIDKYQVEIDGQASLLDASDSNIDVNLGDGDKDYKYHVKAVDAGGVESLWSSWCEVELDTTIPDNEERDVVINEVMWSSSSTDSSDAWIELYNTTDEDIELDDWKLYGAGPDGDALTLSGTIESKDYYLITRYNTNDSECAINDSISSDLQDNNLDLRKSGEKLTLENVLGQKVDETPDADSGWAAGEEGSGEWISMERTDADDSGSNDSNWHSCTDGVCNDLTYWDSGEGNDYGTPKALNHSGEESEDESKDGEKEDKANPEDSSTAGGTEAPATSEPQEEGEGLILEEGTTEEDVGFEDESEEEPKEDQNNNEGGGSEETAGGDENTNGE